MERVKATYLIETPLEVERSASMLAEVRLAMRHKNHLFSGIQKGKK